MTKVVTAPSTSLDGLIAGADDSPEVFRLLNAGDLPSASGWIARIERLLCDAADDSPEFPLAGRVLAASQRTLRSLRVEQRARKTRG
jgi:hypothetical protein